MLDNLDIDRKAKELYSLYRRGDIDKYEKQKMKLENELVSYFKLKENLSEAEAVSLSLELMSNKIVESSKKDFSPLTQMSKFRIIAAIIFITIGVTIFLVKNLSW